MNRLRKEIIGSEVLVEVKNVSKTFTKGDRQSHVVFQDLNLVLREGEIVSLLGKSGCGKSTLLRMIAGLIPPVQGEIFYRNYPIRKPVSGLSMVFQNFALLPWLTVLQNVELGLEAQGLGKSERRQKALWAIDIVGMDGFESAYPKELSGGQCQRVGFARALVVSPEILLMDEPFSALDVLTADNLKSDLLDLWHSDQASIKSIILVTHNIEEAAFLSDRIMIFSGEPTSIKAELKVSLDHPRNPQSDAFHQVVNEIYSLLTTPHQTRLGGLLIRPKAIGFNYRLPKAQISELSGLLETLNTQEYSGKADLSQLSEYLGLDISELFPLTEALEILRFATVAEGYMTVTAIGQSFAEADILQRKKIFAQQLMNFVPLARHVREVLDERPRHQASEERFLEELEDHLGVETAEHVLKVVIDWGRYAELFAYDYHTRKLSLENPV